MSPAIKRAVHGFISSETVILLSRASMIFSGVVSTAFIIPFIIWIVGTVQTTTLDVRGITTSAIATSERIESLENGQAAIVSDIATKYQQRGDVLEGLGTRLTVLETQQKTLVSNTERILDILTNRPTRAGEYMPGAQP